MSRLGIASSALLALCLASCGQPTRSGEDTASIVLALTTVPSDVSCLEVTVSGAQTTTQLFDVTPNQAATLTVQGLASGSASISERAFAVPCAQVTSTTPATWLSTMPVAVTLTPGQISDVTIVLKRAGQVRITTDFQDGTGAAFSVSPAMISFGNVTVGAFATVVVNITNTGTAAVAPPALSLAGVDAGQFQIVTPATTGNPACATTASIPAGGACATTVRFAPTSAGSKVGTLNIGAAANGTPAATVPLSGTGVPLAASFSANPNPVAFGNLTVGFNAAITVNITNTGTTAVAPPALTLVGPDAAQFMTSSSANAGTPACATATTLPAGAACSTVMRFFPTTVGPKSATLNIGADAAGLPIATVALSGTGIAPVVAFSASPNPVPFGNITVGSNAAITVNITNTGTAQVPPPALTLVGPDAAQFMISSSANAGNPACATTTSLPVGAVCSTVMRFFPTTAGAKSATLNIGADAAGVPIATVALSGTGVMTPPVFSASPNPVAFGNLTVGFNAAITVNITNTGTVAVAPPALTVVGTDAAQFMTSSSANAGNPACATATSLPAGAACSTVMRFFPTTVGAKSATLNIGADAAGVPIATVGLSGTGIAPVVSFSASPNPVPFGTIALGTNAAITVNITNTGTAQVAPPALTLAGPDAAQFTISSSANAGNPACATTTSLPIGSACSTVLRFAPTTAGAKSATLNVGMNAAGAPILTVGISGTGANATFSATPNPLNLGGVSVGASSSGIVTITNTSGFATPPPAFTVTGTNAGQFTVVTPANTGNPPCATTASLAAGAACTTSVRFAPISTGAKTATLNLVTGAAGGPAATVSLTGSGV